LEQLGADLFVFPANKPLEDTSNLPPKKEEYNQCFSKYSGLVSEKDEDMPCN
jgi:hypothetical protein